MILKRRKKGFTLIEIMTVVVIIGVLSTLALTRYNKLINRNRWSSVLKALIPLRQAAEMSYLENGTVPSDTDLLDGTNPLSVDPPPIPGITWRVGVTNFCAWGYQYYVLGRRTVSGGGTGYATIVWNDDGTTRAGYCDAAGLNGAPDDW